MIYTYEELRTKRETELINGAHREKYQTELYKRYTGKDPAKTVYNGFRATRPDGERIYYTIHYRTDNARPYAIYINGSQSAAENTYIYRGACVRALNQIRAILAARRPDIIINDLNGAEIIT